MSGQPVHLVNAAPVLLYDGFCALCNGMVSFVLDRDPTGSTRFAPLHGAFAAAIISRHPQIRGVDSIVLVEYDGSGLERVRVRSDAALRIGSRLGGAWRGLAAVRVVPRFVRDAAYDLVARFRYRAFGRYDACPTPPPQARHRFLD